MNKVLNLEMFYCNDELTGKEKGIIKLPTLAKERGMKIFLEGKEVLPESFNECGEPIFSEEFAQLIRFKANEIKRNGTKNNSSILFNVIYEERHITVPLSYYNSTEGIKKYLTYLDDVHKLLKLRKMHVKAYPDIELSEFVLFGKYFLDKLGNISRIGYTNYYDFFIKVSTKKEFTDFFCGYFDEKAFDKTFIPNDNYICPCCGKKFTIEDMDLCEFDVLNDKICHKTCKKEYIERKSFHHFVKDIMDFVYPNAQYEKEEKVSVPSLIFHTEDGDISIRYLNSKYYIEWHDNFKYFNYLYEDYILLYKDNLLYDYGEIINTRHIYVPNPKSAIAVLMIAHRKIV